MISVTRTSRPHGSALLVIEDDEDAQVSIRSMLSRIVKATDVHIVGDLLTARQFLREQLPRAIVADYHLPDGSIVDLNLRDEDSIGLVVMTGRSDIVQMANLYSIVIKPRLREEREPYLEVVRGALIRPLRPEYRVSEVTTRLRMPRGMRRSSTSHPALGKAAVYMPSKHVARAGDLDEESVRKTNCQVLRDTGTVAKQDLRRSA